MAAAGVSIRAARPADGEVLREIAIAAKAHWGYDEGWVRSWAAEGDFSPEALAEKRALVAELDGRPVGFATLLERGEVAVLDDLWVEPEQIGRGIGSALFRSAAERARELGAATLEWEAEPNAVGFYEKMGARRVRDSPPTQLGRSIPVMALDLTSTA